MLFSQRTLIYNSYTLYTIHSDEDDGKICFQSVEKLCTGRVSHFLTFSQAILFLKHHPTGYCETNNTLIEWVRYYSDDEDSDEDDDHNDDIDENDDDEDSQDDNDQDSDEDDFDYENSCCCCTKSWTDTPNEFGICQCWCKCGKDLRECKFDCYELT